LARILKTEVEGWQVDRVRDQLRTGRYFHGIYYPKAFQVDAASIPTASPRWRGGQGCASTRKRPSSASIPRHSQACGHAVGAVARFAHRALAATSISARRCGDCQRRCLPVWRYAGVTEPLGERLAESIAFQGSVMDSDGIDPFPYRRRRPPDVVEPGDHLGSAAEAFASAIQRRIRTVFPRLGKVPIADVFGGAVGLTVHGMPQIGQLRKGLWVASGFGRQGLSTSRWPAFWSRAAFVGR